MRRLLRTVLLRKTNWLQVRLASKTCVTVLSA